MSERVQVMSMREERELGIGRTFNTVGYSAAGATALFLLWLFVSVVIAEARISGDASAFIVGAAKLFGGLGAVVGAVMGTWEPLQ
jgi:hypothetical protein